MTRKIEGDHIYLAPIRHEDSEIYARWLNEAETSIFLAVFPQIITPQSSRDYFAQATARGDHLFGITLRKNDTLIGSSGLLNIDFINRKAEIGLYIGAQDCLNQGYGSESVMLLLDYGFQVLNLNSIHLIPFSFNPRAIRCYEKCGFKIAGRLRETCIINGKKYDQIYMDILASEFPGYRLKQKIKSLLPE
ncbi:MAG: GNAT family protein [Syntrophomonadaceae bacterium]